MGQDDLYKKKKEKTTKDLLRQKNSREAYKRILIVCEGSKTEPNYFKGLCREYKLPPQNIKILAQGADPSFVVNSALRELEKDNSYDTVYCVFDRDEHPQYQTALDTIAQRRRNATPIHAIYSIPSFEYWLLLHFDDTTKPYERKGKKSPGDQVMSDLKKHYTNYVKGEESIFQQTKKDLQIAISRATRNHRHQIKNNSDNPLTLIYLLVNELTNIKD